MNNRILQSDYTYVQINFRIFSTFEIKDCREGDVRLTLLRTFDYWNGSMSTKPCQHQGQRENVVRVTVPEGFTMMLRRRLDRAPGRVFFQARPARGGFGVGRPGWLGHETLPPGRE